MHLWYMIVLISNRLFCQSFYFTELCKRTCFVGVAGSAMVTQALLVWCFQMVANTSGKVKQLQIDLRTVKRSHCFAEFLTKICKSSLIHQFVQLAKLENYFGRKCIHLPYKTYYR